MDLLHQLGDLFLAAVPTAIVLIVFYFILRWAFFLPLLEPLVRSCRRQEKSFEVLRPTIRAYEIDAQIAITLRLRTGRTLEALGIDGPTARHIARAWIRNEDFLVLARLWGTSMPAAACE